MLSAQNRLRRRCQENRKGGEKEITLVPQICQAMYALYLQEANACLIPFINKSKSQFLGCPSKVKSHKFLVTPAKLIPQILGYPGKIDPSDHTNWTVHILSYCTVWVAMHCTCLLSPPWATWNIAHGTAKSANMNYKCKTTWGRGVMSTTDR